jgi:hypothetical protein
MQIYPQLSARIQDEILRLRPEPVGHINYEGIQYNALPLFGTIGEVWLLRSDGSLWRADSDSGMNLEPLPEGLHTIALVVGSARYPWLRELLPARPERAITCIECGGRGRIGPGDAVFCHACSALGWRSSA